ncbi:UNVERIFIED_CONTAM: hypothetical protein Sradi_7185200 [Sesamum radiatum]|uniref:Uncharacterized protein n=1 Tax=Sesamum radiatum TaxID=300843 RepID=A0AAW2IRB1_SESRA
MFRSELMMQRLPTFNGDTTPAPGAFNLAEFLALAHRVVDDGDVESWAALNSLKQRWIAKFGDGETTTPPGGLRPVASRVPTPFPQPLRAPRRAVRTITAPPARVPSRETQLELMADSLPSAAMDMVVAADAPPPLAVENAPQLPRVKTRRLGFSW